MEKLNVQTIDKISDEYLKMAVVSAYAKTKAFNKRFEMLKAKAFYEVIEDISDNIFNLDNNGLIQYEFDDCHSVVASVYGNGDDVPPAVYYAIELGLIRSICLNLHGATDEDKAEISYKAVYSAVIHDVVKDLKQACAKWVDFVYKRAKLLVEQNMKIKAEEYAYYILLNEEIPFVIGSRIDFLE